jgi:hypothetical protein
VGSDDLEQVTTRLVERLSGVNPGWFGARVGDSTQTRADVLRTLVVTLADLGRTAASGAPVDAVPHAIGLHALADQIEVLAADVRAAPGLTVELDARAVAMIRSCYDALWV